MNLDDRKKRILRAIVKGYLETGEPVGSRTISKFTDLNLSSATIRNEMADLEELGYLEQPHTSAGRIPSDKGYRFYVDELMQEQARETASMKEELADRETKLDEVLAREDKLEDVLRQIVRMLAQSTNYATLISAPHGTASKLKFVQLSRPDDRQILAVIVAEGNIIRNRLIDVTEPVDDETLLELNMLLNTQLAGLCLEDINLGLISAVRERAGEHEQLIRDVIDAIAAALGGDDGFEIYTSGAHNILRYPELADRDLASGIIGAFEEKQELRPLVEEIEQSLGDSGPDSSPGTGVQVYIGSESPVASMKDCSVVSTTYDLGGGLKGTVAIIGPKRMNYDMAVSSLKSLTTRLDDIYGGGKR